MPNSKLNSIRPINTAVITSSISRSAGGLFWSVQALSEELTLNNCQITVYAGEDKFSDIDQACWQRVDLCISRVIGPRAFGYQKGLVSKLTLNKPDVVHLHGLWMYPSAANVQMSKYGTPYIISPHGMLDEWALKNSFFKKRIAKFLYEDKNLAGASCLHALCKAELNSMRALGIRVPVALIPNGIYMPLDLAYSRPECMASFPEDTKFIFFLGRIHPKKGLLELLNAWSKSKSNKTFSKDWVLIISGWDQNGHEAILKNLAMELGIINSVIFIGPSFDKQKEACLSHSDAFILPSLSEGLPMAVLEAWSYGLPVVMTQECNLPEGFDAEAAIDVKPNSDSIADGLMRLFKMTDAERAEMGSRGKSLVASKFKWGKIAEQMADVYRWILGQSPPPSCVNFYGDPHDD